MRGKRRSRCAGYLLVAVLVVGSVLTGFVTPTVHAEHPGQHQRAGVSSVTDLLSRSLDVRRVTVRLPDRLGLARPGPGLYGGTLDNSRCNSGSMLAFLATNPAKATAWAQVQRIAPTEIPGYVAGLTAVALTSEITVTSYGYSAGQPIPVPMILPTGTALLIDSSGRPRALCYCGNPLTADVAVTSFVAECEKSLAAGGWRQGQVDYPRELSVNIDESASYLAAVAIRTTPLPPGAERANRSGQMRPERSPFATAGSVDQH